VGARAVARGRGRDLEASWTVARAAAQVGRELLAALDRPVLRQVVPCRTDVPPQIKVVCFNIQRGQRILPVLGALRSHSDLKDADVICLQEVDRFCIRTGGVDIGSLIARELEMNLVYGVEFYELNRRRGGGDHGNAVLTRFSIQEPRIIPLPTGYDWSRSRTQPRVGRRMAMAVDLLWGPHRVRLVNAHLENQCLARSRMAQLEAILAAEKEAMARGPSLLVGDLNTFMYREPRAVSTRAANAGFEDVMPSRPRATWAGVFKLDWILAKGLRSVASGISRDVRSSDHKPLWAVFAMPDLAGLSARTRAT
jgi:endonuclease/exonuclease/phosphatase family metal-dependent hydrolase